jgi:hypothetical protein
VFEDIRDYDLAFKRINSRYATETRGIQLEDIEEEEKLKKHLYQ